MPRRYCEGQFDRIDRWTRQVLFHHLPSEVPRSLFMAAIVCPGDNLTALAAWMTSHEAGRVRFYLHKNADAKQLAPIRDAGLELRHVRPEPYANYGPKNKGITLDLSDQTYQDFRPRQ